MNAWLSRMVLAMTGALFGAGLLAVFEAGRVAAVARVPFASVLVADVAVLAPVASIVGLGVAGAMLALDPDQRWGPRAVMHLAAVGGPMRARASALALALPGAVGLWLVGSAQSARAALVAGPPAVAGLAMAAVSTLVLVFVLAAVLAALPWLGRWVTASVPPAVALFCGLTYALAALAAGVRLGDASGNGPTALAIFGVLARPELDLSPVVGLALMAVAAWAGERAASVLRPRAVRIARASFGALVVAAAWGTVVREARALSAAPEVAHAIETDAPLGHIALALARRATDHDGDGASALFAGGDCDDGDPRRSPNAADVPGNGIDEDCSGADLPVPVAPAAAPPRTAADALSFPHDLNLVLITIDTLRIDLGFMGYPRPVSPNLDALAARSTVFDRAYSMASYTGKSVGPTMIGKYPSECLRDGAHFDTYFAGNTFLAERLRAAGFHTMGAASYWYFKPKYGLTQGIDTWDMSAMPADVARDVDSSSTSPKLTDAAIALLSDPRHVDGRFFLWVHYFDPHANYVPHPEAPDFRSGAKGWAKPLYDGEVWFTDHHLGRLLDYIASQPWGARTAIAVTADHGEAFDEHGMNWHGVDLWEPLVRVPLVVHVPGIKPHRVPVRRSLVDLVPTLLDVLGLPEPRPGELSGRSTAAAIAAPDRPGSFDERDVLLDMPAGPQVPLHRAILVGPTPGLKLMSEGAGWFFLFDVGSDPGELDDLGRDRRLLAKVRAAFDGKLSALRILPVDPAR